MTCQEFQEVLPYIIESGGNADQEGHLRECQSCSELVRDLRYIAEQAKLLLPMHDPSPRVWAGIEQSLARGGLVSEGRTSRPGQITTITTQTKSWTPLGWALALVAVALFAVALINYNPHLPATQPGAQNSGAQSAQVDGDDQQLLSQVSDPDVRRAYEDNLREVNAYITDAQQAVNRDPQDAAAHEYLLDAYQQKEMLYQMATVHSLP